MSDGGSGASMVDAQFTTTEVLRPFDGFEEVYQGELASLPIAFPGRLDPRAGKDGFSSTLLAGIPIPQGARIQLWLPMAFSPVPPGAADAPWQFYQYTLVWRYRSLKQNLDEVRAKQPARSWHQAAQPFGAPNGMTPEYCLPAAFHVIANQSTEPATGPNSLTIRREVIVPRLDTVATFARPLTPAGAPGTIQQGIYDPTASVAGPMPVYVPFWTDAEGDELIILANRVGAAGTWDFTDPDLDLAFSNLYGTGDGDRAAPYPGSGIYLQTGTNP